MKTKKMTIIAGIVLMSVYINTISAQTYDFRSSIWGMNNSSVKATEKTCKLISEDATKIIYDCSLADIKGTIIYTFTPSNKLMRTKYFLKPDYININFYIRDFKMLQELLIQKYGEPSVISFKALGKQSVNDDEWAAYLSAGQLRNEIRWNTDKCEITLTLSKVGDKPAIQIDYISKEFSKLDMQERKNIILRDI